MDVYSFIAISNGCTIISFIFRYKFFVVDHCKGFILQDFQWILLFGFSIFHPSPFSSASSLRGFLIIVRGKTPIPDISKHFYKGYLGAPRNHVLYTRKIVRYIPCYSNARNIINRSFHIPMLF